MKQLFKRLMARLRPKPCVNQADEKIPKDTVRIVFVATRVDGEWATHVSVDYAATTPSDLGKAVGLAVPAIRQLASNTASTIEQQEGAAARGAFLSAAFRSAQLTANHTRYTHSVGKQKG